MIRAEFTKTNGKLIGFTICGHSGYAESGSDVVCASVSSVIQFSVNLLSESFGIETSCEVDDNVIKCEVLHTDDIADSVFKALVLHLQAISDEFPKTIKITISEV